MSRSVLITGGNRGLGLAIATRMAKSGDRVAVTYRGEPPAEGDLLAIRCDVTDTAAVDELFTRVEAEHGPAEVVVANAGITRDKLAMAMSDEDFATVLDANLAGAFRVARRAAKNMVRARFGRLVFVSSVNGMSGAAGQVNYAASKTGLIGLARSLARELGPRGITANVVAPGYAVTEMTATLTERVRDDVIRRTPLGRLAEPDEVAEAVQFLASAGAGFITGALLPVDGGLGMGH